MHIPPRLSEPFRKRVDAFTSYQYSLYAGDAEALHRTRVASRRLRELVPVVGLDADTSRKLSRRLKTVTRQLGRVRELDVLLAITEELGRDARYSPAALARVRVALDEERAVARDRLSVKLPLAKMQRLSRRLARVTQRGSADERSEGRTAPHVQRSALWAIDARMTRRASQLRAAVEAAGAIYVPERLHDVRIAAKKLRYATELRAEVQSLRGTRTITVLTTAQDLLGRLHDLEVLIQRARQTQASCPLLMHAWRELGKLIRALEDDCRALHARYIGSSAQLVAIARHVAALGGEAAGDRRAAG